MDGYEQLPLHQAVVDDDAAEMRRLLAAGADLHAKDDLGFTAISEAIRMTNSYFAPSFISCSPSVQPGMTWLTPKLEVWPRL